MTEILIFSAKALVLFLAMSGIILLVALLILRSHHAPDLQVTPLHERWKNVRNLLNSFLLNKEQKKAEKRRLKQEAKREEVEHFQKVFVVRFKGDLKANQVESLREEVSAVLQVATPQDEVVVVIESPGGAVTGYGLGAAQLLRIRQAEIPLTVCVDEVAASGGYLMAAMANKILVAPFAVIGSIGVVAGIPNMHRLLKRFDVDYKEYTAGEFKRTVSFLGEITPKGEQKFLEQLEETHRLFKAFVSRYRPQIDIARVATGEYWYGEDAVQLGLVDEVRSSDDYLMEKMKHRARIYQIKHQQKTSLSEKIAEFIGTTLMRTSAKIHQEMHEKSVHKVL